MGAGPVHDPRFDPQTILQALPEKWRPVFLAQHREAWEAAREPGEHHRLPELLSLWRLNSIAFADPSYEQRAQEAARGAASSSPWRRPSPTGRSE